MEAEKENKTSGMDAVRVKLESELKTQKEMIADLDRIKNFLHEKMGIEI